MAIHSLNHLPPSPLAPSASPLPPAPPNQSSSQSDQTSSSSPADDSDDSDDIPLGQRHPDALRAQVSMRAERAKRRAGRDASKPHPVPPRQSNDRDPKSLLDQRQLDLAATAAKLSMRTDGRDDDDNKPLVLLKRQKSLAQSALKDPYALPPDDLARRLEHVQRQAQPPPPLPGPSDRQPRLLRLQTDPVPEPVGHPLLPQTDASVRSRKHSDHALEPLSPYIQESVLTLSPQSHPAEADHHVAALLRASPSSSPEVDPRLPPDPHRRHPTAQSRAATRSPRPGAEPPLAAASAGLRRGNTLASRPTGSRAPTPPQPLPARAPTDRPEGSNLARARSVSDRARAPLRATESPPLPAPSGGLSSTKSTARRGEESCAPAKSPTPGQSPVVKRKMLIKLAIVDQSRSMVVEIDEETGVKELLNEAERTGELEANAKEGKGPWGVFEVWKALGIERPIRDSERIIQVIDTWTTIDTEETHLVVQKHELAGLAISKRSFTSGTFGGNLWCEMRPGKWSKKWVLLRENGVYLCANEKGKDEMFLCTMAKFDVYSVPPWAHTSILSKAPRDHAFGLKSLDKLSFFETKADFVHRFCCKDRLKQLEWIRRLYDARSFYVLSQQGVEGAQGMSRSKLSDPPGGRAGEHSKPALARSGTVAGGDGGRLGRKPTLIRADTLSRFKQGTLLGDLGGAGNAEEGSQRVAVQAILPAHVMPLVGDELPGGLVGGGGRRKMSLPGGEEGKVRTWEQMGPDERKAYLSQVTSRAKMEGKTLLQFEKSNLEGLGVGISPVGASRTATGGGGGGGVGLGRSRTLGSASGRKGTTSRKI